MRTVRFIQFAIALLFISNLSSGQKCVISATKQNILFVGIANPVVIASSSYSCKEISLITDKGKVDTTDEQCSYFVTPYRIGKVELSIVERKVSGRIISKVPFQVKAIPCPEVLLAGIASGEKIEKSKLKVQMAFAAVLKGFDFDARIKINSYTVIILRNEKALFVRKCETHSFPSEVLQAFQMIEKEDKVIFTSIYCTFFDGKIRKLQPAEFIID